MPLYKGLVRFCFLIFAMSFLVGVSGCVRSRASLTQDNKTVRRGVYQVSPPGEGWNAHRGEKTWRGGMSGMSRDAYFVSCPGPKVIVIYSAGWDPWKYGRKKREAIDVDSFEGLALDYLEEQYNFLGIKNEIISHQPINLAGLEAVEAVFKTEQESFESCQSLNKTMRIELNKYVVIKRGQWDYGRFSRRGKWPEMIVLWYGSPIENFEEGVGDFDEMVQSFHFLKN